MSRRHAGTDIDAIAAAWVAREDRASLSEQEADALGAWLDADARHLGAYARAKAGFVHVDRAVALGPGFAADDLPRPSRRRFLQAAGLATAACLTGLVSLRASARYVSTGLGEVLRVPLDDGSAVTLNSATRLAIETSRVRQTVRLIQGEALFDVAASLVRSLVVDVGQSLLSGSGSSFTASRLSGDHVEVLVRSGEVKVAGAPATPATRADANSLVQIEAGGSPRVRSLNPMEVSRRLSWRDGMLSFDGETLADAARQFARYSSLRLAIEDPSVARMRVVGLYAANDPAGFARAVASSMDLQAERSGNTIWLRRKAFS